MKNVVPSPEGGPTKVKLKVRLNVHGVFNASNPQLVEKLAVQGDTEPEPMDTNETKKDQSEQKSEEQLQVGCKVVARIGG